MLDRDYVIEFAGMPKSGKTTVLDVVSHYLRRRGVPIDEFHGGGRYAPIDKSHLALLNIYLAAQAITRVVTVGFPLGIERKIYLLDRGPVDRLIFSRALADLGRVPSSHLEALSAMFAVPECHEKIDLAFVFVTHPELSLDRESLNKLVVNEGRVMNPPMLEALRAGAVAIAASPPVIARSARLIDTALADGDVRGTAAMVVNLIARVEGLGWLALP